MHECKNDSGFMLQYGPIVAVLNTTNTNKRIRIFHTRVKLRYLITDIASLSILTIQLLVVCLTFEILFTKILDFFNMWIFVRTSTNLAHLAIFQAMEFIEWPVPKMRDIFVCQTVKWKQSFPCKTQHSVTCCSRRTRAQSNLIPSLQAFHWEHLALWLP